MRVAVTVLILMATTLTAQSPLTVYVYLKPDCPICQGTSSYLRDLFDKYHQRGVRFVGVFPGTDYSRQEIDTFCITYNVPYSVVVDSTYKLTDMHGAWVTPQAIVIDGQGALVYRGRVNDLYAGLGKRRQEPSVNDVRQKLDSLLAGVQLAFDTTMAYGCFIER
jgi:peroxiredoxin